MTSLQLDEASTCLLLLMIVILITQALFLRPAAPLLHPILLGRQAEAARVRHPGESPVWTNAHAATLIVRPSSAIKGFRDLVPGARPELQKKIHEAAARLQTLASKLGASAQHQRTVALACEEAQNLPLALACSLVPGLLPWILPQDTQAAQLLFSQRAPDALITNVEDLADAAPLVFPPGLDGLQDAESQEPPSIDVYQTVVLTSALSDGKWSIIELSNLTITSAMYNLTQILTPQSAHKLSSKDDILSDLPLAAPLGFTLALTAVHLQSRFQFAHPITLASIIKTQPSVVFCSASGASSLHGILMEEFSHYPFNKRVLASKVAALRDGLLSRSTLWDMFPLKSFRKEQQISSLRAVVVFASQGDVLPQERIDALRTFISAPVIQGSTHPLQPVPLTISHIHDFQRVHSGQNALVGPPSANVEIKATGVKDDAVMAGRLWCRGPAVLAVGSAAVSSGGASYEWWDSGLSAQILTNGTVALGES